MVVGGRLYPAVDHCWRMTGIAQPLPGCYEEREEMVMEWRDIASAPKDGTPILLYIEPVDEGYLLGWNPARLITQVIGWWEYWGWTSHLMEEGTADTEGHSSPYQITIRPLFWMPLPAPPTDCAPQGFVRPEVMG